MDFLLHVMTISAIFGILALGLNIIVGNTGLISVAHAGFFGIGAYAAAITMTLYHAGFTTALFCGIVVAGVTALLTGLLLSGLRGDYFVLGTLGFNAIVYGVMLNLDSLTRGPLGIPGIPRPALFGMTLLQPFPYFLFVLFFLVLISLVFSYVTRMPFGRVLKAIREDEEALRVFGYRVLRFKLAAFVLAAMIAAVAGALYATYIRFVDPSAFVVLVSVNVLVMIILGGLATLRGSIAGAVMFIGLYESVRFLGFSPDTAGQMREAVVGLMLLLLMLFRPRGLFGEFKL